MAEMISPLYTNQTVTLLTYTATCVYWARKKGIKIVFPYHIIYEYTYICKLYFVSNLHKNI